VVFLLLAGNAFSQMTILSGPEKGSYYKFVDDMVNVLGERSGIKLLNRPTGGSGNNFREITNPMSASRIALIQSDYLSLMQAEDKLNNTNKTGSLRVVLELAREEIQFVTKKSSGLVKLQDLAGKKVAIGSEDQGSLATGRMIRERSGVEWNSYYADFELLLKQLTDGSIDAFLLVGSAPVSIIDINPQVMTAGGALLELDDFNGWARYYENDTIHKGTYKWLERDIPTFGVRTLLVVNDAKLTSDDKQKVEAIRTAVIQNLDVLRKQGHPKWKEVHTDGVATAPPAPAPAQETVVNARPADVTSAEQDEIVYKVQILSSNESQKYDEVTIDGQTYKTSVYYYQGAYRYTIGEFSSASEASGLQSKCKMSGYPQAFVAAFKNNQRITGR
jgi:TRAP transporter TAXI family solute receptor